MRAAREKLKLAALFALGLFCIFTSNTRTSDKAKQTHHTPLFRAAPVVAVSALGHSEFGWSIVALQGLAQTLNAWNSDESELLDANKKELIRNQFYQFYENINSLAAVQLGMREIFTYPASYLAFEKNDLENAVRIAELGAQDTRLAPDLALVVAYLKHLFLTNLNEVADAYERVLSLYPQAVWMNKTIEQLRRGVDPMLRTDKDQCQKLLFVFPKAKKRLVERGICRETHGEDENFDN